MLALSGKFEELRGLPEGSPRELLRVTTNRDTPKVLAGTAAYLVILRMCPAGFVRISRLNTTAGIWMAFRGRHLPLCYPRRRASCATATSFDYRPGTPHTGSCLESTRT